MKKVFLIITDAGGGHRSSANALKKIIEERHSWEVSIVNFYQEIVGTKHDETVYNYVILKQGWTKTYWSLLVPLFKLKLQLVRAIWIAKLEQYWDHQKPDIVISLLPFVNRELYQSLQKALPEIPFITLITDIIDCPPHYWIEQQEQLLICPTKKAVEQAIFVGHREENIFHTSGLVINPQFYQPITHNRNLERQALKLEPDLPTALVMFGGQGSKKMIDIANYLEKSPLSLQLIFICGHNKKLANTLRQTQNRVPRLVETFTNKIPYYMHLSDLFIGKPGPGVISEAVKMNLPVIIEINNSTMKQEKYYGKWIKDNQVGIVVNDFKDIEQAVAEIIKPEKLDFYKENTAAINNQGIFEVVDILTKILS